MQPFLHQRTFLQLQNLVRQPHGSYILYGPAGVGRMTALRWVAKSWHGHAEPASGCPRCLQIEAESHPDVIIVAPEGNSLGIAQIQQLGHRLMMTRHDTSSTRLVAVDQADSLTLEAQNALLKLLEEPPLQTVIVLLATSPRDLLPTLRSRAQPIDFLPLPDEDMRTQLQAHHISAEMINMIVAVARGRLGLALRLAEDHEAYARYERAMAVSNNLRSPELFNRLLVAGTASEAKDTDMATVTEVLLADLRQELRTEASSGVTERTKMIIRSLQAIETFSRQIQANVSPKTALSRLAMELA